MSSGFSVCDGQRARETNREAYKLRNKVRSTHARSEVHTQGERERGI